MKDHDGPHTSVDEHPDCFGCRVKGVQIGVAAMPTRANAVPPRRADPAWERGKAGERRPDGSFMPYLNAKLSPVGVKEMQDHRSSYESERKRQLGTTTPLTD